VPVWASEFRNYVVQKLNHQNYEAVLNWQTIPHIQQNHPSLEHLAPLFFAMGLGIALPLCIAVFQWVL
jgi:4,5-DOPA dioxygenase extradiol